MENDPRFNTFLDNWMTGGKAAREAFRADLAALLQEERDMCARRVETFGKRRFAGGAAPSTEILLKRAADEIRELT